LVRLPIGGDSPLQAASKTTKKQLNEIPRLITPRG
jgi:hypothetical protein